MVEIVFENKTSGKKTTLKLDSYNNRQETCTISQIISDDPDFASVTPFKEGSVTTVGAVREFADEKKTAFSCTAFDGDNGGVAIEEYYNPTPKEDNGDSEEEGYGSEESKS